MRENYYRTPPAHVHNGIPDEPKWLRNGSKHFVTIDDARIVSITHLKGKALLRVHFVSESDQALDRGPQGARDETLAPPEHVKGGVTVLFVPHAALQLSEMLGKFIDGDETRFVPVPDEVPFEGGEMPAVSISQMHKDNSAFVFLRGWNTPACLRLHLTEDDRRLLSARLHYLAINMDAEEWDANVQPMDVPMMVGEQPEATEKSDEREREVLPGMPRRAPKRGLLSRALGFIKRIFG